MPFAAALSEHPVAASAVGEVVGEIGERLGARPDLAVLFVTGDHLGALDDMAAALQTLLDPVAFIGATAGAVLAGDRGVEERPGVALWAARLPEPVTPVHLSAEASEHGWVFEGLRPESLAGAGSLLLIADPFTFPAQELLATLQASLPELAVIGGLASAARGPGGNRLVIGGRLVAHGAVGVLLPASVSPATVVSQGCRPIGQPYTVTGARASNPPRARRPTGARTAPGDRRRPRPGRPCAGR